MIQCPMCVRDIPQNLAQCCWCSFPLFYASGVFEMFRGGFKYGSYRTQHPPEPDNVANQTLLLPPPHFVEACPVIILDPPRTCPICLCENMYEGVSVGPCNHVFHKECLRVWTDKSMTCPMCRTDLNEKDVANGKYVRVVE